MRRAGPALTVRCPTAARRAGGCAGLIMVIRVIRACISGAAFLALVGAPLLVAGYAARRAWQLWHRYGWAWEIRLTVWVGVMLASLAVAVWLMTTTADIGRGAWRELVGRRRAQEGCCPECGYDLRGSHDRCPECGTRVPRRNRRETTDTPID